MHRRGGNYDGTETLPGFENLETLKSVMCSLPNCGEEVEIFSDEFDSSHVCGGCKGKMDFIKCK